MGACPQAGRGRAGRGVVRVRRLRRFDVPALGGGVRRARRPLDARGRHERGAQPRGPGRQRRPTLRRRRLRRRRQSQVSFVLVLVPFGGRSDSVVVDVVVVCLVPARWRCSTRATASGTLRRACAPTRAASDSASSPSTDLRPPRATPKPTEKNKEGKNSLSPSRSLYCKCEINKVVDPQRHSAEDRQCFLCHRSRTSELFLLLLLWVSTCISQFIRGTNVPVAAPLGDPPDALRNFSVVVVVVVVGHFLTSLPLSELAESWRERRRWRRLCLASGASAGSRFGALKSLAACGAEKKPKTTIEIWRLGRP